MGLNLISVVLKLLSNNPFNSNNNYFLENIFIATLSFYLCMIVSSNTKIIIKSLKYGLPLFIFSATLGSSFELAQKIAFLAWFIYLFYLYKFIIKNNDDIEIVVPGKADDENLAMSKLTLFSKEFYSKDIKLIDYKTLLSKKITTFKFITKPIFSFYTQYIFVCLLIVLYFSIKSSTLYFSNENVTNFSQDIFPLTLMFVFSLTLSLIPPKFILLPKEELFFTRAITKKEIYLSSFISQGISLFILCSLSFLMLKLGAFYIDINYLIFPLFTLWIYIAGEIGIFLIFILIMSDLSSNIVNNITINEAFIDYTFYSSSFLISLKNTGYFAITMWLLAFAIRFFDYNWYCHKEIGLFRGFSNTIKNLAKLYLPSVALISVILPIIFYFNPLIRFLNLPPVDFYDYYYNKQDIMEALLYKEDFNNDSRKYNIGFEHKSTSYFEKLIKNPYDSKAYLKVSTNYLENLLSDRIYNSRKNYIKPMSLDKVQLYLKKIEYLNSFTQDLKKSHEYFYNQSLYYYFKNSPELAISSLEKANIQHKAKYYFILGMINENKKDLAKSLENYKNAFKYSEKKIGDYYLRKRFLLRKIGNIYWDQEKYEEALDYFIYEDKSRFTFFETKPYYEKGLIQKIVEIKNKKHNPKLIKEIDEYLSKIN